MNILKIIVYLYLFLRPFYFFNSGSPQISDYILIMGFVYYLLLMANNKKVFSETIRDNIHYLLFLILVVFINSIYFIIYGSNDFILSSLYYLFNYFVILIFSVIIKDNKFLKGMSRVIRLSILIQLLLCITGIGQNWLGTIRYMGTFNDPNQFAYYILISYCIISLLKYKLNDETHIFIYLIICAYLIIKSTSTGMMLGIGIIAILNFVYNIGQFKVFLKKHSKKILYMALAVIAITATVLIIPELKQKAIDAIAETRITNRINEKINKINNESEDNDLWHDRGYDIITSNIKYIIYGAGQGGYTRFQRANGHSGEIHATFPSILFYYGLVPTAILLIWICKKIKKIPMNAKILYLALFIESFTLLNQRQAFFWIIIILATQIKEKDKWKK